MGSVHMFYCILCSMCLCLSVVCPVQFVVMVLSRHTVYVFMCIYI
jgi:hypothetical protein